MAPGRLIDQSVYIRYIHSSNATRKMVLEILWLLLLLLVLGNKVVAAASRTEVLCTNSGGRDGRVMVGSSTTLFHEQPIVWVEWEKNATIIPNDDDDDATLLHWKPLSTTVRYEFQLQGNNTLEQDVVCLHTEMEVDSTTPTDLVWIAGMVWQEANDAAKGQERHVWVGAVDLTTSRMLHYHEEPVVGPYASLEALERDHTQYQHTVLLLRWMESSNTTVTTTKLDTANWTGSAANVSSKVRLPRRVVGVVTLGLLCVGMLWAFTSSGAGRPKDDSTQKDASTTGNTSCDDSVGQTILNAATTMVDTSTSFQLERHSYSRSSARRSPDHVVL